MAESQNYTPSQILAIGQRAEAEGKYEYATQFYAHLADHFRHTAEGHEALYGLQRIEHYRQLHAADQARGNQVQAQAQAPRREPQLSTHQPQARQTTGGRPAARTAQAGRQDRPVVQEHHDLIPGAASRSSLPAPVSDHEDEEDARMPRLVARAGNSGEDGGAQDSSYRVGRLLTTVLAVVGWVLLCVGVPLLLAGLAGVPSSLAAAGLVGMPLGVEVGMAAIVWGIMLLLLAHVARAVFDSAAASRELVEIERAKAGW
jgi:hypothetical protein